MKLKTRLCVSFLILLVAPVVITLAIMIVVGYAKIQNIERTYQSESRGLEIIFNPVRYFSSMTDEIYDELAQVVELTPEKLADKGYLEEINKKLSEKSSFLLIEDYESQNMDKYYTIDDGLEKAKFLNTRMLTFMRGLSFQYPSGEEGTIYIITSLNENIINLRKMFVLLTNILLAVLMISIVCIAANLYRSIIRPIIQIKDASEYIKEGNLDFEIKVKSVKEIENFANDYNELRSRLKEQAEEKVKYDSESRELISNISHDLKTPITAVKGYVEGIIDGVADTPEKMDRYIKTIYNKANEMDRLINELTFYSKIDTNRIPYTFTKINVEHYFNDCIEEIVLDLESKNIELNFANYTPADTLIIADAEQMRRVINNIVGNSIKYLDKPKGFINIRIRDDGEFIEVEIEDNGKGIGESDLPFIFDRFYRTDASRNSAKGGSGIGLSIVKKIIEDHGGEIWVTSKELTGTAMYFKLRKYQEVQIYE
ncbi:sensor histidine kinase [Konateibacter massiliensis]|uniref:sensor histidine kinase n=1 Tax=Konateibacter massiliensis TaxID=2002841 RepID=UPI000C14A28C|nr:HAMP domain-containing sensor histidine kinase [Konateibacter massiliensis]